MTSLISFLKSAFDSIITQFASIGIADVVDILVVAAIIYLLIGFIRRANLSRVVIGIVILIIVQEISGGIGLNVINLLLRRTLELGFLALVVLFQPELRRVLEKVGSGKFAGFFSRRQGYNVDTAITQTLLACTELARKKIGALIVFERDNRLGDQISTGTVIDAETTAELLKNIFYPKAPLHDGAVVIRSGRIASAGCMLPLSGNGNLSRDLGMRHRAGIGMSEHSDAVVVIVSEETGSLSVAVDGMLKRHLSAETAEKILRNGLQRDEIQPKTSRFPAFGKGKKQ